MEKLLLAFLTESEYKEIMNRNEHRNQQYEKDNSQEEML